MGDEDDRDFDDRNEDQVFEDACAMDKENLSVSENYAHFYKIPFAEPPLK